MSALTFVFRRGAALILVACVLASSLVAAERIPPAPARFVTDATRTLSNGTINALNARLEQYERDTSNQILVAMFARMETNSSVEDYTVRVAESWKVGQKGKSNGAVLFIFKQDRQIYIQVGYGLEPTLTDAVCHQIVENILKPKFRSGDFNGGVRAAVDAMIAATRGEFKGTGRTNAQLSDGARGGIAGIAILSLFVLVVVVIVRGSQGPLFTIGGPRTASRRRWWDDNDSGGTWGGWSSGGGGGWSGGGGGGGFSGGGGSFGGGGAGGKW